MALKNLSLAEMLTVSGRWVKEGSSERELLASTEETRALLTHLDGAHQGLLEAQPPDGSALARVVEQAAALDARHDVLTRGTHGGLTAGSYLSKDEALRAELIRTRDALLPSGLSIVIAGYREEAGAGKLTEQQLTPARRELLGRISFPEGTLLDAVLELIRTAAELGTTEDERAEVQRQQSTAEVTTVLAARNRWIRTVHALNSNLELAQLEQAVVDKLLAPLEAAVKAADLRAGRSTSAPEEPPPAEGTAPPAEGAPPTS